MKYGIEVVPPSGMEVDVEPLIEFPPELKLKTDEVVIAVGLKFSCPGQHLKSPMKITLPHCAVLQPPSKANVVFYTRESGIFYLN